MKKGFIGCPKSVNVAMACLACIPFSQIQFPVIFLGASPKDKNDYEVSGFFKLGILNDFEHTEITEIPLLMPTHWKLVKN